MNFSGSNIVVNKNSTNRHKKVLCRLCGKSMRSDHLQRHVKTHKDLAPFADQELRSELKKRKHFEDEPEKNVRQIKKNCIRRTDISKCI